jgi:outer membrane protein OmpA-like peptidoglycan-associated protein
MIQLRSRVIFILLAVITAPFVLSQNDKPGSKDYSGITRMPGYYIYDSSESRFDTFTFATGNWKNQDVEGHKMFIRYRYDTDKDPSKKSIASDLEIVRNYQNAARSAGGKVIWDSGRGGSQGRTVTTIQFVKDGKEVWMQVSADADPRAEGYFLNIIERQAMQQVVTLDAAGMASSISNTGSVAIYGINFDTASSAIKPESEPAVDEIAKLLTNNPALKVGIVGHTDMVGDATANMKLSQARAQSVINELVSKHGIAAARLVAFGNGPWAPVASNKTDDGRAKNRRVELVEIATK